MDFLFAPWYLVAPREEGEEEEEEPLKLFKSCFLN